jgi:hypothetical protein
VNGCFGHMGQAYRKFCLLENNILIRDEYGRALESGESIHKFRINMPVSYWRNTLTFGLDYIFIYVANSIVTLATAGYRQGLRLH